MINGGKYVCVKCDEDDTRTPLIIGEIYESGGYVSIEHNSILIKVNDHFSFYPLDFFVNVDVYRNSIIDNILDNV